MKRTNTALGTKARGITGTSPSANEQTNMVSGSATSKCLREIWSCPRRKMMTP